MNPRDPALSRRYRDALLGDVIPFWLRHSGDPRGGYFTCLGRDGAVYDTDKFVWLQARQVWTFAMLHRRLEPRVRWLAFARSGARFLARHGRAPGGHWYFSLTRDGRPLTQPYSIFSDCFAAMAFGEFGRAANEDNARRIARATYRNVVRRAAQPKGRYSKAYPGTRPLRALSVPMILANVTVELGDLLRPARAEAVIDACLADVFGRFLDRTTGVLREHAGPDGAAVDCFEGRLLNPGHGLEAMWFVLDIAEARGDRALIARATDVILGTLRRGWDNRDGGIFYFLDREGHPPQQLEWDQKLWWVHVEALVALLKAFRLTRRADCWRWFERVHDYTWAHFPDPRHGEWFGYLNRAGEVLLPLKGGKWKGCFHIPRALFLCANELDRIAAEGGRKP